MIDAQSRHQPLADEAHHEPVCLGEDVGILHADGRQVIDVEEPAVVDLLSGHAPVGQPVRLVHEQVVEQIEAAGVARRAIESSDVVLDEGGDLG